MTLNEGIYQTCVVLTPLIKNVLSHNACFRFTVLLAGMEHFKLFSS